MALGDTITYNATSYTIIFQITDGTKAMWVIGDSSTSTGYKNRATARRFALFRFLYNDDPTAATPQRVRTTERFKFALWRMSEMIEKAHGTTDGNRVASPVGSSANVLSITNVSTQAIVIADAYSGCPALQRVTGRWSVTDTLRSGVTRHFPNLFEAIRYTWRRVQSAGNHN